MDISVIIPVYNAEKYVERAVRSALQQKECSEVVLVEDKSPDNALEICKAMAERHEKIKLFQHENEENHGPGPSRNLGIEKAKHDYIAFLDADDFYLPNRFSRAAEIFSGDPTIDGVYEAVGCQFENEEARNRFFANHSREISTLTKRVEPDKLFYYLFSGRYGYLHLNGFVCKKNALHKAGLFPKLKIHEDTSLFLKLSVMCKLVPGELAQRVSCRYVHLENTINNPQIDFRGSILLEAKYLLDWMRDNGVQSKISRLVKTRLLRLKYSLCKQKGNYVTAIYIYLYYRLFFKKNESILLNLD